MLKPKNLILLTFLLTTCLTVHANTVMTVQCDEPNGTRTDFYAGEFKEIQDGFAGVKPRIVFDSKKAQNTTVLLEPADLAKQLGFKKTSNVFKIASQNTDHISMVGHSDTTTTHLYTLYPKLGVGYFTIHHYANLHNGEASTATLIAKCKVLPKSMK